MRKGLNQPGTIWIADHGKDDGNTAGLFLQRQGWGHSMGDNRIGPKCDDLLRASAYAIEITGPPEDIKMQIASLDPPQLLKPLLEQCHAR